MASLGMPSQSEVDDLVRSIRVHGLLNKQLQNICTLNGLKSSGVKIELQRRIIEHIHKSSGNTRQFQQVKQSIQDTQKAGKHVAYSGHQSFPAAPASGNANRIMSPHGQPANLSSSHFNLAANLSQGPKSSLQFKQSPFYQINKFVGEVRILDEMQHHRNSVYLNIKSQDEPLLSQCGPDSNLRVMLFCAASIHGVQNIAFPQNSELKVNGGDIKANLRGLKNKQGSTLPVDLTRHLRLNLPHYSNRVTFTYALTSQKFHLVLCVCRVTSVEELVKSLESTQRIPKEFTVSDLQRKAADPDVVATSQKLSLKCPLSFMRLRLPCRGQHCKHIQCFDATSYLQLQEQGPQWRCPICNGETPFESLAVDMYVQEILSNTSDDLEQVTIEPDGQWHIGKDSSPSKKSRPSLGNSSRVYGEDDDVIAILDDKGLSTPFTPARSSFGTPSFIGSRESSSVPKPSTRGTKRPAEVIDLTLDSDDEPPRPAKKPIYDHAHTSNSDSIRPAQNSNLLY